MRQHYSLLFSCTMLTQALVVGCTRESVAARVTCANPEFIRTSFGFFNTSLLPLGALIDLDTLTGAARRLGALDAPGRNVSSSPKIDSITTATTVDAQVELSANVSAADRPVVEAAVQSYVKRRTVLVLQGVRRVDLVETTELLSNLPLHLQLALRAFNDDEHHVILLVSSVGVADHADLRLSDTAGGSARVNLIKAGKFDVAVSFDCGSTLSVYAKQGALFYKVAAVEYDPHYAAFIQRTFEMDPSRYHIDQAEIAPNLPQTWSPIRLPFGLH